MNLIIEQLTNERPSSRNQIIGGIGTIEGRIWVAYGNRQVVRMPIITSDRVIPVQQPVNSLNNLERGPTGYHDLIIASMASVHLLYCHKTVCKIDIKGNVTLCGRTRLIFNEISEDSNSGDDSTEEYELKMGEHLRLILGTVRVRVSASGHTVYLTDSVKYEKFFSNIT